MGVHLHAFRVPAAFLRRHHRALRSHGHADHRHTGPTDSFGFPGDFLRRRKTATRQLRKFLQVRFNQIRTGRHSLTEQLAGRIQNRNYFPFFSFTNQLPVKTCRHTGRGAATHHHDRSLVQFVQDSADLFPHFPCLLGTYRMTVLIQLRHLLRSRVQDLDIRSQITGHFCEHAGNIPFLQRFPDAYSPVHKIKPCGNHRRIHIPQQRADIDALSRHIFSGSFNRVFFAPGKCGHGNGVIHTGIQSDRQNLFHAISPIFSRSRRSILREL